MTKRERTEKFDRYQKGNQKSQTTQWPKEKGQEKFEDTKGEVGQTTQWPKEKGQTTQWIRRERTRPYNDQKRKDKKSLKIPKGESEVVNRRGQTYNDQKRKDKKSLKIPKGVERSRK